MVRARWKWFLLGAVFLLVATEVVLNALKTPVGQVKIVNTGADPILNLVATNGPSRAEAARVDPQDSVVLQISGRGKTALALKFNQFNNPVTDFEVAEFDPAALSRQGSRLVLEVRPGEVMRYQEPDDTPTRWQRFLDWVRSTFNEKDTEPTP
jgi:hypothetical protein